MQVMSLQPNQRLWLDNVQCTGQEPSIYNCPHDGWGNYECTSNTVAGIICNQRLYGKQVS